VKGQWVYSPLSLRRIIDIGLALDLKVADGGTTGKGGTSFLPLQQNLAAANTAREGALEVLWPIESEDYRIKEKVIHGELFFKLALDIPVCVAMDAGLDSVLLKEDPAGDLLFQVIIGRATEQARAV
jgi:hypothetical protein